MDFSPTSRRNRKSPTKSEIYSTFVVHSDDDGDDDELPRRITNPKQEDEEEDLYGTMLLKDDDPNDDDSLPPLLKRLPIDFDAAIDSDDESISGTMIVKTDRNRNQSSPSTRRNPPRWKGKVEDDEDNFSTFVVRSTVKEEREIESVSGTVVRRRTSGGGDDDDDDDDDGSTMSRAVASMQAVGELGFGKQRKGSSATSSSHGEEGQLRQQTSKMSSSSIPDNVTREDPSTKYELLHELGTI